MLQPGTTLGSYEIVSLLGEGGMGQVYRAVDKRLDRSVAIKILPSHLASHPGFRERFEREARSISSLSHPHVCALYDVGSEGEIEYLVMEYLEGETLAERLARGRLPLDQALRYGVEIAQALDAAHRKGITHRDLKPGNVMLTSSGVKLLDFGLAKTAATPMIGPDAPTMQHTPVTAEGSLVGTFQYMAPEQLEGAAVDHRTDIFALGAVLYEMVTGRRAFDGRSRASIIAAILDAEPPPVAATQKTAPESLDRVIRTCLAKNPDERFQSASDVALQLRWIADERADSRAKRPWALPVMAIALLALLLVAGAMAYRTARVGTEPVPVHLSLTAPAGYEINRVSISPNGTLAISATEGAQGRQQYLLVRELGKAETRVLGKLEGNGATFWSPDSQWIAYFDGGSKLLKIPVSGGSPETITESGYGFGAAWGEDGKIVYSPAYYQPLYEVPASGGKPRQLTKLDTSANEVTHAHPVMVPGGVLYLSVLDKFGETGRIMHIPRGGGEPVNVLRADSLIGYSAPYLLFVRRGDVYAIEFDPERVEIRGEARRIIQKVLYSASNSATAASVNARGDLVYPPFTRELRRLVWYGRDGQSRRELIQDEDIWGPSLSRDGKHLLMHQVAPESGESVIFRIDLERGTKTLMTPAPRNGFSALWHPSGGRFAFTAAEGSTDFDLFIQDDDPQAKPRPLWRARSDNKEAVSFTSDGRHLVVREYQPESEYDLWLIPLDAPEERRLLVGGAANDYDADISPDGRFLAYVSNFGGSYEVYVRPLDGGRAIQLSNSGGFSPRWTPDGTEIYYATPDRWLMVAAFAGGAGAAPRAGVPQQLFRLPETMSGRFHLSPDGDSILVNEAAGSARPGSQYHVFLGWKEQLAEAN